VLLDLVGIASEGEIVSTNSEGIIEVGGAKGVGNSNVELLIFFFFFFFFFFFLCF